MTKPIVTPDALKAAVRELLLTEPELFTDVLRKVIEDASLQGPPTDYIPEQEVESIVEEDFAKFDAVFRALA